MKVEPLQAWQVWFLDEFLIHLPFFCDLWGNDNILVLMLVKKNLFLLFSKQIKDILELYIQAILDRQYVSNTFNLSQVTVSNKLTKNHCQHMSHLQGSNEFTVILWIYSNVSPPLIYDQGSLFLCTNIKSLLQIHLIQLSLIHTHFSSYHSIMIPHISVFVNIHAIQCLTKSSK